MLHDKETSPADLAQRLDRELDRLDAHVAAHGAHVPEPYLPVRLGLIALAWAGLFAASHALAVPLTAAVASLIAVPLLLIPELVLSLVHRKPLLRPRQAAARRDILRSVSTLTAQLGKLRRR